MSSILRSVQPATWVLFLCSLFICWWFRIYFSADLIASVDLSSHIRIIERYSEQWWRGNLTFYDPGWFAGWPAFQFYGFYSHLILAISTTLLSFVVEDPARLLVHLSMVFGVAAIPWAVYYVALPTARRFFTESHGELSQSEKVVLAAVVSAFSFWFINHDRQWYGIGAAAVMNIGLFSQLFGWLFMLLHLGALFRLIDVDEKSNRFKVSIFYALLFLTHSLTAVFSLALAVLSFGWFSERRRAIFSSHVVALGICGFWLVPFIAFSSTYTVLDIFRPTGDFLELFLRYPLALLLQALSEIFSGGFLLIDLTQFYIIVLLLFALFSARVHRNALLMPFFVFAVILLVAFSSGFVASSVPVGFHYYRFYAYLFLFLLTLLTPLPLVCLLNESSRHRRWIVPVLSLFAFSSIFVTALLPHYERDEIEKSRGWDQLSDERAVLDYFAEQEGEGRVFFEYFDDYEKFPFLSAHLMSALLEKWSGFEVLGGLFLQSSLSYRMPVASAAMLGIPTYNGPFLFTDNARLSDATKIAQLRDAGVTHLVLSDESPIDALRAYATAEPQQFGRYHVIPIAIGELPRVRKVQKHLIGYLDYDGKLPFRFLEYFVYSREELYERFEFIELAKNQALPSGLQGIVVQGASSMDEISDTFSNFQKKIIPFIYPQRVFFDHYSVRYQHNPELDAYAEAEHFLENEFKLRNRLLESFAELPPEEAQGSPVRFSWREDRQSFELAGLNPGEMVRVNYSYFPFWKSKDGELYRGLGERIYFVPRGSQAEVRYFPWSSAVFCLGLIVSLLSTILLCRALR